MASTTWIAAGCFVLVGYTSIMALVSRVRVWQLVGRESYKHCHALTRQLTAMGSRTALIRTMGNAALIAGVILAARHFQKPDPWSQIGRAWPASLLLLIGVLDRFRQSAPAMVILLGSSNGPCRTLQHALTRRLFPLRVVSLLDADGVLVFKSAGDSFRLPEGVDWLAVVRKLVVECPLVVADLRSPSKLVDEELSIALGCGAGPKIASLMGDGPSIELPATAAAVTTPDELLALLAPVAAGRAPMPNPQRPLGGRLRRPPHNT